MKLEGVRLAAASKVHTARFDTNFARSRGYVSCVRVFTSARPRVNLVAAPSLTVSGETRRCSFGGYLQGSYSQVRHQAEQVISSRAEDP